MLEWTRLPIITAILPIMIAGCIVNMTYLRTGGIVLVAACLYLTVIVTVIVTVHLTRLPKAGQTGLCVVVAALPLYLVKVVYLPLSKFGSVNFSPAIGDWRMQVGMQFFIEISTVLVLTAANLVVEPIWGGNSMERLRMLNLTGKWLRR